MSMTHDALYQYGGVPVPLPYGNFPRRFGRAWFVDGTTGVGSNAYPGTQREPFSTITYALTKADEGDLIYIYPKKAAVTDTDPTSYAETFTISTPQISLIGVSGGPVQGGVPQIKIGAGTTAMCTIAAPGVTIQGLGFNGASSTGGGILLDDDGGSTKSVWGTVIRGCHFKNNKCHATNGSLGGAIYWGSNGGGWQILIEGNRFYKNVADIVVVGTGSSVPQDVVIVRNTFSGPAASVDVNIKTGGSGVDGIVIEYNSFTSFPALGGGSNIKQLDLTGSIGMLSFNSFGCNGKTFGAAGNNLVPATVMICGNYQDNALVTRT